MTEEKFWRTENDPHALLSALFPTRSEGSVVLQTRKCRHYLLACARRQWNRLPGVCREIVALAEVFAEYPRSEARLRALVAPIAEQLVHSAGDPGDLEEAARALRSAGEEDTPGGVRSRLAPEDQFDVPVVPEPFSETEWRGLASLVYLPFVLNTPPFKWVPRELHATDLLREIYYNPYVFIPFDSDWRTSDTLELARAAYNSRNFGGMPFLADALQEAGCTNSAILDHCRDTNARHVRGCWVVDRILNHG
ncbi:hypothetical protein VT84_34170 [Gemmata sp. SH-PL17]|uniref:hypothetical protein n=1 Tax=Gemmata sp. SH-PL17 TaxID=1630693 RepID=UPI0004B22935|nr:hypothetical protein [Gemmata sp. SH-PL17]AMV29491.1 hypothetical protein VT84_34170 [Gemmata sp. SH-PL17]